MAIPSSPLAQGNRLQRAYARWAAPRYACLAPEARAQAELLDAYLYSRRGLGLWAGLGGAFLGSSAGLVAAGLPLLLAMALCLVAWVALPLALLSAWMTPSLFVWPSLRRRLPLVAALGLAGGVSGFLAASAARPEGLQWGPLLERLWRLLYIMTPAVLLAVAVLMGLMWTLARLRRQILERELATSRLEAERDAAARRAAEAQLKLLRAQIQPHFIFNTLAALQHWVDTHDARAPALLRTLTGFLRHSTELLSRDSTTLADELALAQLYAEIMRSRLGERMACSFAIEAAALAQPLPPGLLLTLLENAIEHGVAPALQPARVDVSARCSAAGFTLEVLNTGLPLAPGWAEGLGLANCRERLAHRFGEAARFSLQSTPQGTCARVRLDAAAATLP